MLSPKPNGWWIRAAVAAALAGVSIVVACTADIPSGPGAGPAVNATGASDQGSPDFAYEVAVLDRKPQLSNAGRISEIMEQLYPSLLQKAGIGGTVLTMFVIQPDGSTDPRSIRVLESANEELAAATVAAVRAFTFRPGQYKGENVRVLIQMPVTWKPISDAAAQGGRVPVQGSAARPGIDLPAGAQAPAQAGPDFAYEVSVLESVPQLINKEEISGVMKALYPPVMQQAGIEGTVVTQFVIRADGLVDMGSAKVLRSPNGELSAASLKALERFRFRPGVYRGAAVRTLIQMPITWQPEG